MAGLERYETDWWQYGGVSAGVGRSTAKYSIYLFVPFRGGLWHLNARIHLERDLSSGLHSSTAEHLYALGIEYGRLLRRCSTSVLYSKVSIYDFAMMNYM